MPFSSTPCTSAPPGANPGEDTEAEPEAEGVAGWINVPCFDPMSTIAHCKRSSSQKMVACSLDTSSSFRRILGVSDPDGATSRPIWISE